MVTPCTSFASARLNARMRGLAMPSGADQPPPTKARAPEQCSQPSTQRIRRDGGADLSGGSALGYVVQYA